MNYSENDATAQDVVDPNPNRLLNTILTTEMKVDEVEGGGKEDERGIPKEENKQLREKPSDLSSMRVKHSIKIFEIRDPQATLTREEGFEAGLNNSRHLRCWKQ